LMLGLFLWDPFILIYHTSTDQIYFVLILKLIVWRMIFQVWNWIKQMTHIRSNFSLRHACFYHSDQNHLSSSLVSENTEMKMYKTVLSELYFWTLSIVWCLKKKIE
jgi:hypothetical protein